jgi:dolichol-phosphate mannosyltransferase
LRPSRTLPPALSIVVPTYNERDRLPELVRSIFDAYDQEGVAGELVIVDDNSPDGTGAVADTLAVEYPLRVVHRAGKLGLGTAVIEGFAAAAAPIVGVADADLSHPPGLIPRMLAVMQQHAADFVIGSRYIPGGGTRDWEKSRVLMSRFACLLARGLTPVRDVTSGFFLMRRDLARGVRISAGGFKICLELLIRSEPSLVLEVPYVFAGRTVGESKMNLKEATGYLRQLSELRRFKADRHSAPPKYRALTLDELRSAPRSA